MCYKGSAEICHSVGASWTAIRMALGSVHTSAKAQYSPLIQPSPIQSRSIQYSKIFFTKMLKNVLPHSVKGSEIKFLDPSLCPNLQKWMWSILWSSFIQFFQKNLFKPTNQLTNQPTKRHWRGHKLCGRGVNICSVEWSCRVLHSVKSLA